MGDSLETFGPAALPRRPMLRPGVRVTRIGRGLLRFGLGPDSVVLPEQPELLALLPKLESGQGRAGWSQGAMIALLRLLEAGLLVSADEYWSTLRGARHESIRQGVVSALFARGGGAERVRQRARCPVGLDLPAEWEALVAPQLVATGLGRAPASTEGNVVLIGSTTPRRRRELDEVVRAGRPHLLVSAVEGRVLVGPFVVPGKTACLRCVDAHHTDRDLSWPLAVEQYADASGARLMPEPLDPTLLAIALSMAVHDLGTWADGESPRTWSATVEVSADLELPHTIYRRHPRCGCSWGDLVAVDDRWAG